MALFGNAPVVQQDDPHSPGEPCTSNSLLYDIVEWVAVGVSLFTSFIAMVILVPIGTVKPYKGHHDNEARRKVPPAKPRLPIVDSAEGSVSRNDVPKTEGGNEVYSRPKEEVSSSLEIPAVAGQSSSSCPPTTKTPSPPVKSDDESQYRRSPADATDGGNEVDSRPKEEVSSSLEIPAIAGQSSSSCPPTTKTPSPPVKSDDESPYRSESPADATDGTDGSEESVPEQSSGIPAEEVSVQSNDTQ